MTILLTSLLAAALVMTALVSGIVAKNFKVKRPHMPLAFLAVALVVAIVIGIYKIYPDSLVTFAVSIIMYLMLLILLLGMRALDALVITIAGIATIGVILFAGGVTLDKYQKSHLMSDMTVFIQKTRFLEIKPAKTSPLVDSSENLESGDYTESALMPEGSQKQRIIIQSKTYHSVRPQNAYKYQGLTVRLLKKDGTLLKGTLVGTERGRVVLSVYLVKEKGVIKAPVTFSSIQKLEVYQ